MHTSCSRCFTNIKNGSSLNGILEQESKDNELGSRNEHRCFVRLCVERLDEVDYAKKEKRHGTAHSHYNTLGF